MKLFIVESPSKCGKIKSFLGADYNILASVGHIREIPKEGGLNIDVEHGFEPKYDIIKGKKDVVKNIKVAAEKSDTIYLASDPDREGSFISYSIYSILSEKNKKKCKRIMFNEITKKAILDALNKETKIEDHKNLIDAQKARQVLDRLIGYRCSPLLWFSVAPKTSCGRVQSIALMLICNRETEIANFKSEDFWFVEAILGCKKGQFAAKVVTKEKDNRFLSEKLATEALEKLKKSDFILDKIEKETKSNKPNPPFDTASLQTACSSVFGWSATKSKVLAQGLYTGGFITYIRTDSYDISEDAMKEVRDYIKKNEGEKYLSDKPNKYEKKSSAVESQEAHESIHNVHMEDESDKIDDADARKMYKLIRDRFIACQMSNMLVDVVTYHVKTSSEHNLIAKGQTIKFDGWFKVYNYSKAKEEILPEATEKEKLELKDIKSTKHSTIPPARYNDGSLIKKMEAEGIGRPSTRDTIIKNIQDKGYVEKKKGKPGFFATLLGMRICEFLTPRFTDFFMDIKYTASLEDDLDEIAKGKKTYLEVVGKVYEFLSKHVKDCKENMPKKKEATKMGAKCKVCKEGEIVERNGRYGIFYACSAYPACKVSYNKDEEGNFTLKEKKEVKTTGRKCPECQKNGRNGELVERTNKSNGNTFIACNAYPKCKFIENSEGTNKFSNRKSYAKKNENADEDTDSNKTEDTNDIDLDI